MNQPKRWKIGFIAILLVVLATGIWACSSATQQTSTPVTQEQTVLVATDTPTVATTEPTVITATVAAEVSETTVATDTATGAATSADVRVFTIDQSQSEARFILDEELLGSPKTVVGVTPLVTGEITVDLADLTKTTLGTIQIDASDLTTDSDRRDGAMQRFILQSSNEANRYIRFTPTAIVGVPSTASAGDTVELQITGDLTISGVTKPVTFVTTVTVASDKQISGLATAQVLRSDYNLTIPSVPSVANVTDAVQLQFQFIANAS